MHVGEQHAPTHRQRVCVQTAHETPRTSLVAHEHGGSELSLHGRALQVFFCLFGAVPPRRHTARKSRFGLLCPVLSPCLAAIGVLRILHPRSRRETARRLLSHAARGVELTRASLLLALQSIAFRLAACAVRSPFRPRRGVAAAPRLGTARNQPHRHGGQGVEQLAVVGHQHAHAAEAGEGLAQRFARRCVQVIRGLVEQQHGRLAPQRSANLPALALTGRQRAPALELRRREAQLTEQTPRGAILGPSQSSYAVVGFLHALPAKHYPRGRGLALHAPGVRREHAGEQLEQRGLSRAVLAGEPGPAFEEARAHVFEYRGSVRMRERQPHDFHTCHACLLTSGSCRHLRTGFGVRKSRS